MEDLCSTWRQSARQLLQLLRGSESDNPQVLQLLEQLNHFSYPIQGLATEDTDKLLAVLANDTRLCSTKYILYVAQLVSKLLTLQKLSVATEIRCKLFEAFIASLPTASPPTELLYGAAALIQDGAMETPALQSDSLLGSCSLVVKMALSSSSRSVNVQRAALNLLTVVCSEVETPPQPSLVTLVDSLLYCLLNPTSEEMDPIMKAKLLLSQLKCLHVVLSLLTAIQSYPSLPSLLAALKSNMATGLPGQTKIISSSIQPLLSIPPSLVSTQQQLTSLKQKPQSVAGPHSRKKQHRNKSREKVATSLSKEKMESRGGGLTPDHSSDSDSASVSSGGSLKGTAVGRRDRQSRQTSRSESLFYSSSDSDLSDSEPAPNRLKFVNSKVRFQAHSCLTSVFQKLDRQTSFSYWKSFFPDCPRPPNSPPSLLTCIVKDPTPKCRGGALSVLCVLLEGSKTFLAAADDRPRPSQPYTPYSSTLGSIVRELHRNLLLALTAESHPTTLTQLIKAVSLLVANTPYHQLSEGYITKILATLARFSRHRDSDVQVACLTCYGAAVSITPPLHEVEVWLSSNDHAFSPTATATQTPWLVQHSIALLQIQNTLAVQTEALQVLSALSKFYFSHVSRCWSQLRDLYLLHLASAPPSLQPHILKMLEELLKSLSSAVMSSSEDGGESDVALSDVCAFWEDLLGGRLAAYLSASSSSVAEQNNSITSQACNVLSTMGAPTMAALKTPFRTLALTLPLGLCRDETASSAAVASAVRVLGVFVLYDSLKTDDSFLLDCHSVILHCLSSTSLPVRVQASWALANLTDILSPSPSFPAPLLVSLHEAIVKASSDNDKVKCNAVRAAGNTLRDLTVQVLPLCESTVVKICSHLSKCINSGSMKSRWNACYACHSAFSNAVFTDNFPNSVADLLKSLCLAVQKCKNFKVRNNAALALSTVAACYYPTASGELFVSVWGSLIQTLENSHHQGDFSEYKHAATLRTQVCSCICHTIVAMTTDQAVKLSETHQPPSETLSEYVQQFVQEAVKQESGELRQLLHKTRENLNSLCLSVSSNTALQELLKAWLKLFTEPIEREASTLSQLTATKFK